MLAITTLGIYSLKLILTLTLLITTLQVAASGWFRLEGEFEFPKISEAKLEKLIWDKISEQNPTTAYPRSDYTYQYFINEKGVITIQGFCKLNNSIENADLTKEIVIAFDGGSCYFRAEYFVEKGEMQLVFNGVS